ncbi:VOC family protein [Jannaschia sp. LMIT008]|uniref:VOC family protein n=1 Tax=Jannaschia maritima TaxID=3032585 RepID=UPI002810FD6C|nr:VOC family protein [Jannaschia sp. LMIT008]
MFSHVTLGTDDLDRARAFYDAVLARLGLELAPSEPGAFAAWKGGDGVARFYVVRPRNGAAASVGNGVTVAFEAPDRAAVDAGHAAGLSQGGSDEGAPGLRPIYHPDFYGAYLRDPDGNKIALVCHAPPAAIAQP